MTSASSDNPTSASDLSPNASTGGVDGDQLLTSPSLLGLVATVYQGRHTGVLEVLVGGEPRRFHFRSGELHLVNGHPLAQRLASFLSEESQYETRGVDLDDTAAYDPRRAQRFQDSRPAAVREELESLVARIARFLAQLEGGRHHFRVSEELAAEDLVGPLPTSLLVMELAVLDKTDERLLSALGGPEQRLQAWGGAESADSIYWLDREEAFLLSRLEESRPLSAVLSASGLPRRRTLELLNRLRAVELIAPAAQVARNAPPPAVLASGAQRVSDTVVMRFTDLVAADLGRKPEVGLEVEEHRQFLANLLQRIGELTHYELLELPADAAEDQVRKAYDRLARRVHPSHGDRLDLQSGPEVLKVLFERVTEAYLVLSDPKRRSDYNRLMDIDPFRPPELTPEETEAAERQLADEYFRRAKVEVANQEWHSAHQLLKEVVRRHATVPHLMLLAQVQSKNPNWLHQAAGSYRRAAELDAKAVEPRIALAMTLEEVGDASGAMEQFEAALELMPGHPQAEAGIRRVKGLPNALGKKVAKGAKGSVPPLWRRLLDAFKTPDAEGGDTGK
ncbi:MAG: DnaJ domain-containing protein [Acidobacteriota bacterium]